MEKKPILRLGLDIGTTSVGWALTENFEIPEDLKLEDADEFEPSRLLIKDGKYAVGARIIPTTADVLKNFNKGENVSKCKDRTQKRGARRLLQRYRARRERLLTVLRALSWIPATFPVLYGREYTENLRKFAREGKKYPDCVLNDLMRQKGWQVNPKQTVGTGNFAKTLLTPARVHERFAQMGKEFDIQTISEDGKVILPLDWLVFYLRHLATREQLSPEELALVLYHLNQKRGFKSSKKGNEEENKTTKDSEKNKENNGKPTEEAKEFKNYFVKSVEKTDKKYKGSDVYSVVLSESSESELEFAFTINKAPDKEHKDLAHFQANLHQSMQVSLQKSKGSFKCELPKSQKTVTEEWAVIRKIVPLGKEKIKEREFDTFLIQLADEKCGKTYSIFKEGENAFLKITLSTDQKGEQTFSFKRSKATAWTQEKEKINASIAEMFASGEIQSVADFHLSFILKDLKNNQFGEYSIRNQIILRKWYVSEFDNIFAKQSPFLPNLSENSLEKILSKLYQNDGEGQCTESVSKTKQKITLVKNGRIYKDDVRRVFKKGEDALAYLLNKHIIYFQRKLKSQVSGIAECRFERFEMSMDGKSLKKKVRVTPLSSPAAQEFRIWNEINNLKYAEGLGRQPFVALSDAEKEILRNKLWTTDSVKVDALAKLFGKKSEFVEFNKPLNLKIAGHTTAVELRRCLRKLQDKEEQQAAANILDKIFENEPQFELLWHILYSIDADLESEPVNNPIVNALCRHFNFSQNAAVELAKAKFKDDYSSLSKKAINKLLPLMRAGKFFNPENIPAQARARIARIQAGEADESIEAKTYKKLFALGENLANYGGLLFFEAASLVYGNHSREEEFDKLQNFNDIKRLKQHSLRNPIVEKIVNEVLMLVKEIWKNYGLPDEIVIELAREMRQTAEERSESTERNSKNEKENKRIADRLREYFPHKPVTANNIERYKLWESVPFDDTEGEKSPKLFGVCIYSGERINVNDIFDENKVQVDHIIPKSRFFDDSFANKVLVLTAENKKKGEQTAYDYIASKGKDALQKFTARIDDYFKNSRKKKNYLLMPASEIPEDFVSRQLNETRYITKKVREELRKITDVRVTSGGVTDYLRHIWGVDGVMKELLRPRYEALESRYQLQGKLIHWQERENSRGEKHKVEIFEGYSKRLDHRHHLLDAIVIACTRQGHVQMLNHKNAFLRTEILENGKINEAKFDETMGKFAEKDATLDKKEIKELLILWAKNYDKRKEDSGRGGVTKFSPPWRTFVKDVKNALENTIVSLKVKQEMQGQLHDEQPKGEILKNERVPIDKVWEILADLHHKRSSPYVIPEMYKKVQANLMDILEKNNFDIAACKKERKKTPLKNKNDVEIEFLTLHRRVFARRRSIIGMTKPQIESILDEKIRKAVIDELLGGSVPEDVKKLKELLTEDNLTAFNEKRRKEGKFPIFKAVCEESEMSNNSGETNFSIGHQKHFTKGNNYCFVVGTGINKKGERERKFGSVPLVDAMELQRNGFKPADNVFENEDKLCFELFKNDLVFVPLSNQKIEDVDWNDTRFILSRLFSVIKFSGNRIWLAPFLKAHEIFARKGDENLLPKDCSEEDIWEIVPDNFSEKIVPKHISAAKNTLYKISFAAPNEKPNRLGHIEGYWNDEGEFVSIK